MAKKQYTPEEYKAKLDKKAEKRKSFSSTFLKVLAFCLAIAMVYCATVIANTRTGMLALGTTNTVQADSSTIDDNTSDDDSSVDWGSDSSDSSTDDSSTGDDSSSDAPADDNASDDSSASGDDASANKGMTNRDAFELYKKAVANARANAASVIRVKDGAINYKGIVEAGGLSDVAASLMGMFMAADAESIEVKNEPWEKEKLPDASNLTTNGIKKISFEEKGDTIVVTIVAKNATNPNTGDDGVGSIAGVIEESQITGAIGSVPGLTLSNINIAYENVTAVATIEKSTGNLVALNLDAPCVLGLDAKLAFISVNDAKVGIQVITEYAISY